MIALRLLPLLSIVAGSASWPNLRVTFGLNPFGHFFYPYPLTVSEAVGEGWELISSCGDDTWMGYRYADPSDPSLILIYDVNGYIAGSQSGLLKTYCDEESFPFSSNPNYQSGEFYGSPAYFTTAYYVDPAIICEGGRSEAEFKSQGLGDRLLFQTTNGYYAAPMTKNEANSLSEWNDHFCFIGMGDHYIGYNYQPSQDCADVFPAQLLYNNGNLHGFVWQHIAALPGDKWEYPDANAIAAIIDRPPTCLTDLIEYPGLSTMHHYFHNNPWFTVCPFGENRADLPEFKNAMKNM